MEKNLSTLLFIILIAVSAYGQQTVGGTVVDEEGAPMIGVNILEKNTSNGTITDFDGKYELTVGENAILVFSYLGYSDQEFEIQGQSVIDVNLAPNANELDEIIVVGYGVQKKKVVTGAISKVKAEELEEQNITRLDDALQGRTAGVRVIANSGQPGDGGTIRIRGTASFGASDPLYVVDGVIIGGGIDYLNPNDIESIEVLKDAASANIYGARGTGGVVLVTTKKGEKNKTTVQLQSLYGVQAPARLLPTLNSFEYATLLNEASVAAGGPIKFEDPSSLGEGTNWQKEIFRNDAPIQNHQFSVSSGTDNSTYFMSLGYFNQDGIIQTSGYERFTARLNATVEANKHLKFGSNLSYSRIKSRGVSTNSEFGSPLSRAVNLDPITPLLETDPDVLNSTVFQNFAVVKNEEGIPYGISDLVTSEVLNPVAALNTAEGIGYSDKIVASFFGEVSFLKNFTFTSRIGTDLAFWGGEGFTPIFYLNSSNRNDLTSYNRSQNRGLYWIFENFVKYNLKSGNHTFEAVVGTSAEENKGQGISTTITDIPVDNLADASFGFFAAPDNQFAGGFEYLNTRLGYIGRVNYNFSEKYLFSAQMRVDGSSSFGPNNKYGYFPSVSLGWIVSDEDFFNSSAINYLKIRGSWGISGNDNAGSFGFVSTLGGGRNYTFGLDEILTNGVVPDALANPDLRWERTISPNIGFDAKLFRKFSLTLDFYKKTTDGLLLGLDVPGYVGNNAPLGNIADMENKGFDVELGYVTSSGNFDISIKGNLAYNQNTVVSIGQEKEFLTGARFGPQGLEITRTQPGLPINYFFGYQTDGLFQNAEEIAAYANTDGEPIQPNASPGDIKFIDINNDGIIDADDRTFIGDPTAPWTYGGNIDIGWKNFELSIFGVGVYGNKIYKILRRFDLQNANFTGEALERWTGEGTSNDYPRLVTNDPNGNFSNSSDFFLEDGHFFRIKNLQLSYDIPKRNLVRLGFEKIRIYVQSKNLHTFTKYSGFDPEIGGGSYGIDRGFYPQARSFNVGLNASF